MAIARSTTAGVLFAVATSAAVDARAQPTPGGDAAVARLEVVRREGAEAACPEAIALGAAVDALAKRAAIAGDAGPAATVALEVVFEPLGGGFRATLRAHGARTGERVLDDPADVTCSALADAVAIATALLLDAGEAETVVPGAPPAPPLPAGTPARPPAGPLAAPGGSPRDVAVRTVPVDPQAVLALGAPTAWSVDAAVLATTAVADRGGLEIAGWGRRRVGPMSVALGARVAMPSEHRFANGTVEVWSVRGALDACLDLRAAARIALSPCATLAAGGVIAHGEGFDRTGSGALPTVAVGGAAVAAFGVGPGAAVLLRLGAAGAPVRPAFHVDDLGGAEADEVGEAYRAPAVVADAGAGVRLAFD